jgi:hypothetical protein
LPFHNLLKRRRRPWWVLPLIIAMVWLGLLERAAVVKD